MASTAFGEASFCDKNGKTKLSDALLNQYKNQLFCDVVIKVGSKEFHVHANVLAAQSPYFSSFLSQDLPRSFSQKAPQVVEIQTDSTLIQPSYADAVENIIHFMYGGMLTVNDYNIAQVYEMSKIMQLEDVFEFCENCIRGRVQTGTLYCTATVPKSRNTGANTDLSSFKTNLTLPQIHSQGLDSSALHDNHLPNFKFRTNSVKSVSCQTVSRLNEDYGERERVDQGTSTESWLLREQGGVQESTELPSVDKASLFRIKTETFSDDEFDISDYRMKSQSTRSGRKVKIKTFDFPSIVQSNTSQNTDSLVMHSVANKVIHLSNLGEQTNLESISEKCQTQDSEPECHVSLEVVPLPEEITDVYDTADSDCENKSELAQTAEVSLAAKRGKKRLKTNPKSLPAKKQAPITEIEYIMSKPGKEYSCNECDFVTTKVRAMSSHTMTHKVSQGMCFYCDEKYEDADELKTHMTSHSGPSPFECKKCSLSFKTRTLLNLHLPKHFDVKPFVCEICSQSFKWKHALKNHAIVHATKKQHLCDICGYCTAHKVTLKAHKLIHSGGTFKCDWENCTFETTKRQNLKNHMVTHTKERPHVCELCGQRFSLEKNLRRHFLLHYGERALKCTYCGFGTTRQDKLKEHLLKQHGLGTPPERKATASTMNETTISSTGKFTSNSDLDLYLDGMHIVLMPTDGEVTGSDDDPSNTVAYSEEVGSSTDVPPKILNEFQSMSSQGVTELGSEGLLDDWTSRLHFTATGSGGSEVNVTQMVLVQKEGALMLVDGQSSGQELIGQVDSSKEYSELAEEHQSTVEMEYLEEDYQVMEQH